VLIGQRIEPDIAERARLRMVATLKQGDDTPLRTIVLSGGQARDEVAEVVGLGTGRTYERGKATIAELVESAPDLLEQVEEGAITLREARQEVRGREAQRAQLSGLGASYKVYFDVVGV